MKAWIIKNINFGYKYTTNKKIRKQINSCVNEWLINILEKKSKINDILIINGGLFSNTNPSIIAIDDAKKFIKKITSFMNVYLIDTENDVRIFNNEYYSVNDVFSDTNNVHIIKDITEIDKLIVIPYNKNIEEYKHDKIYLDSKINKINDTNLIDLIQFDNNDSKYGLNVYDITNNKNILLNNNFLPKHISLEINTYEDLLKLKEVKEHILYLTIDSKLYEDKKEKINFLINKLNIYELKIKINQDSTKTMESFYNINDIIYEHIGNNKELQNRFEKILKIAK